jgi:F-box interacting protein
MFDRISEFKLPLDLVYARIVGSCNGLLCFSWNYPHNPHAYLCNPSIRKFQKVPDTASSISTTTLSSVVTGLGYNSGTNDYKVVRISYCWPQLPQADIYSLSLGSWKRLPCPLRPGVILYSIDTDLLPVPFVSGALHWMVYVDENVSKSEEESWQRQHFILTFDVNKEKFG